MAYINVSGPKIVKKDDILFDSNHIKGGRKMKTKFIMGGRRTGKTTQLIREAVVESRFDSVAIVASNQYHVICIQNMLYQMYRDKHIVPVITIRDIVTHSREMDGRFPNPPKLYIDNLTACLSEFTSCDIATAVINDDERIREYTYHVDVCCRNNLLNPHIDHVIFNGPATIVFWKDGTKTVVKHDGKGRKDKKQAILYAFIRKIYGEGKGYHNILNEIEEALK